MQGRDFQDQRNKFSAVSRGSQGSKASRSARPHGTASIPASTIHQQPPIKYGPPPHPDAHAAASHPHHGTTTSQEPQGPHGAQTPHPHDPQERSDPKPAQHPPPPPQPPKVPLPHHPPQPPPRDQATDATDGSQHQPIDVDAPADTCHRESPLPRQPQETPSPDPTRDNDDHHPLPTPTPPSHRAPPAAAPAEPYALHNPAAVRQHLRGLGDPELLRLHTSGTTQRIRASTLVQAATLREGVQDFLFDAFLRVARHDRPQRATPDGESPPPTGNRVWVPPIDWRRHLVGHPVLERENTQVRTRYREPNMAHPPPSPTPSKTKEWERETWVARMASLSKFPAQRPGGHPHIRRPAASPFHVHDSHVQSALHPLHHPLPRTN